MLGRLNSLSYVTLNKLYSDVWGTFLEKTARGGKTTTTQTLNPSLLTWRPIPCDDNAVTSSELSRKGIDTTDDLVYRLRINLHCVSEGNRNYA